MEDSTRMMLGLAIGIVLMIVLVMKTKIHTFIALLLASLVTGLIGGMPVVDIAGANGDVITGAITAIKDGFGNTLKSTGIIIGLGVMMGGILEVSGAAEQLAFTFIRVIGKRKEEWALAITGWVVSIPVFADSAIVIFAPLVKAMSSVTGISVISLALSLACGLQLTHCMVPPTPGPLTAAGIMGIDVGQMILLGMVVSILMLIAIVPYCKWIGKRIYQTPKSDGDGYDRKEFKAEYIKTMDEVENMMAQKKLPPFSLSIAPILVPLVLIFIKTIWDLVGADEGIANSIIGLIGEPIVALAIGTVLAIYGLVKKVENKKVIGIMDTAIKDTGLIMLITGAGGSLGNVIKVSGIGDVLGEAVVGLPIPSILIPFIIAALMRIALGSGNVAKLANQVIVALNIAAVSEAMTLAKKMGTDPELVYQAIRGGLAGSTVLDAKAPMMLEHNFKPGFRIELHIKDLNNALNASHAVNAALPLTAQVMEIMQSLKADGNEKDDHSAIVKFYEKISEVSVEK